MVENVKKYAAELVGTMILVFMGCGSAMFLGCDVPGGHLAVALAFGLSSVCLSLPRRMLSAIFRDVI